MSFFIVAVDEKWGIAKDHKIPWHYPEDFAWFKKKTKGMPLIMGYNTYAEIAAMRGYPEKVTELLPGRKVHVITSREIPTTEMVHAERNIDFNSYLSSTFCYVGGSRIYDHAMGIDGGQEMACHFGLVTRIKHDYDCTQFFNNELLEKHYVLDSVINETDDLRFELWVSKNETNWREKGYNWL